MKIALVGPGAVGCVVAGGLAHAPGIELVVGSRTPFERLVVTGFPTPVDVPVSVFVEPPPRAPVDVVLLATKAHQTAGAAPWLAAWADANTRVVVLQNGVEHEERVRPFAPASRIVPVVVSCPARRIAPGVVDVPGRVELIVADDEDARAIAALFAGTPITVVVTPDWKTAAWRKLLFNAAGGAVTTLARRSNVVFQDPEIRALTLALMHEVAAVARAEGAALESADVEAFLDLTLGRAGAHTSSITVDRLAGLPTEWDARNGVVVRKAAQHGIPVPLNAALTMLLRVSEPPRSPAGGR